MICKICKTDNEPHRMTTCSYCKSVICNKPSCCYTLRRDPFDIHDSPLCDCDPTIYICKACDELFKLKYKNKLIDLRERMYKLEDRADVLHEKFLSEVS